MSTRRRVREKSGGSLLNSHPAVSCALAFSRTKAMFAAMPGRPITPSEMSSSPPGASPLALVTGGGGFLGRAIVERLLARGHRVRSLSRGAYPDLENLGVEVVRGDLADASSVRA